MGYYDETTDTGANGLYTPERGYNPLREFQEWQRNKIADTNSNIDRALGRTDKQMASALADLSNQRTGFQRDPYGASQDRFTSPDLGGQFMTGSPPGQAPLGREGGFFQGNRAYNVNNSSQPGISKVTSRGAGPLYTNIDPEQGLAGLNQQMVGGDSADVRQGLDRFARANATWQSVIDKQPTGGVGILPDQTEADNAEKTQRWAMEDAARQVPFSQRGQALMHSMDSAQGNQTQRRGQDMQFLSHLGGLGLQGRIQQENTRLGYQMQGENQGMHDIRSDESARGLAQLRQKLEQDDPLKSAQAGESKARARMLGTQADQYERDAAYGKTPHAQYMKQLEVLAKGAPNSAAAAKAYDDALAKLAYFDKTNGYADGGQVETPEQVMARIQAKYGVSGNTPQPQPQVQVPQPTQKQPQSTGGLMDRLRSVATGDLDRRMQAAGYAEGGPIDVGGRSVHGEGTGKSDSLPAVIDGEHPAALSSGEFVMPVEAVRHFGLDRLNKMVAAARKGLDTGR